jgi:hypothetical protein
MPRRNADPNADPNAPDVDGPDGPDGPDDDGQGYRKRFIAAEEVIDDHQERLSHVEDVLDRIMAAGHVYARAGEDHAKLREHIAARDA